MPIILQTYVYSSRTTEVVSDTFSEVYGAIGDFLRNYSDMKEANTIGADKYFHAKANCEASQRGKGGRIVAKIISVGRECVDTIKNLYRGMTLKESLDDSRGDMDANNYGRTQGEVFPEMSSKDLLATLRPNGLPECY